MSRVRLRPDELHLFLGRRRSGKSHLLKQLLRQTRLRRTLILDPEEEYEGIQITDMHDLVGLFLDPPDAFVASVRMPYMETKLEEISKLVLAFARCAGGLLFVVDEVASFLPHPGQCGHEFRELVNRGRHAQVTMACATQWPGDLPPVVRHNAAVVVVWQFDEERALRWIAGKTNREAAERVKELDYKAHERLVYDVNEDPRWWVEQPNREE